LSRIYGTHAIGDLLASVPESVASLLIASETRLDAEGEALLARARELGIPVHRVDRREVESRRGGRGGASIAADIRLASAPALEELSGAPGEPQLVMVLDGVTDPHNLGAILRSAAAFSATAVVVGKDRSAPLNDAAIRASAGAVAHVPLIRVTNLARALKTLQAGGFWVYGLSADADQSLYETDLDGPVALVLGAEGAGLRPGIERACDGLVSLPMSGRIASLNVSVSAGIAAAEFRRRSGSGN
jgi:23S rRNA (guanosine2251-2'-O)-methyltransferase